MCLWRLEGCTMADVSGYECLNSVERDGLCCLHQRSFLCVCDHCLISDCLRIAGEMSCEPPALCLCSRAGRKKLQFCLEGFPHRGECAFVVVLPFNGEKPERVLNTHFWISKSASKAGAPHLWGTFESFNNATSLICMKILFAVMSCISVFRQS